MAADSAPLDIDLVAASLRTDTSDVAAFVEGLASKLEQAVPGCVRVQRARRGLMGAKAVREISLDAGDVRLLLRRRDGDGVETTLARVSGGITLKTEPMETDAWLGALGEALATEAQRSERTRQALERLLMS